MTTLDPYLLSLEATCASTTLPRSSLYALIRRGMFPAPVKVSARRVAWLVSDIEIWRASLAPTVRLAAESGSET